MSIQFFADCSPKTCSVSSSLLLIKLWSSIAGRCWLSYCLWIYEYIRRDPYCLIQNWRTPVGISAINEKVLFFFFFPLFIMNRKYMILDWFCRIILMCRRKTYWIAVKTQPVFLSAMSFIYRYCTVVEQQLTNS